ncbi:MAG: hypothetical protein AMXMBFR64_11660 [Myxococcales bacterium]
MRAFIAVAFVIASLTSTGVRAAEVCAGPSTVKGIDVSKWQGTIDWAKVAGSGVKFAIARAANGTTVDQTFATNWAQMKAKGIVRGAYQYFQPDMDPVAQANLMVATIGALGPGDLPPVIDVEQTTTLPPEAYAAKVSAWLSIVEQKTGRKPMIYTGYYFWKDYVKGTDVGSYPLWIARYCTSCCPMIPSPWTNWAFWQYSSTGSTPGISGNVDQNHFNGTMAQLEKLAGQTQCTPKCEGDSVIVGADCGKGDCAAYGAFCSTAGGVAPHCVSALCVASPAEIPKEKAICFEGKRYQCDAKGGVAEMPCPGGQLCLEDGGVHCGVPCSPSPETCNGVDDDCDGKTDEDLFDPCAGCGDSSPEVCNGKDDDCDGQTDEGVTNACGGCGEVGPEVCNGLDDDCDGHVDDGVTNACGGCGDVAPEVCNGADDDCDGVTDEGCGGCVPVPEVCDGLDNDCDGVTDEGLGLGEVCSVGDGVCEIQGHVVCAETGAEEQTQCDAEPVDCDDGDPCTIDWCDPALGCLSFLSEECGGQPGGGGGPSWGSPPPADSAVTEEDATIAQPGSPTTTPPAYARVDGGCSAGGRAREWSAYWLLGALGALLAGWRVFRSPRRIYEI